MAADKKRYEQYQRALTQIQRMAEQAVAGVDTAALTEEQYMQLLCRLKKTYGDMGKQVAYEYYFSERAARGADDDWGIGLTHNVSDSFVRSGVAECVARNEDVGKFIGKTAMMAAERQIKFCASYDPQAPRWAFVAHPGACEWCIMISSNGWRYRFEETAEASRHPGCTCAVAADFDKENPSLAGYDPQGMYERYRQCRKAVEPAALAKWKAMSAAERASYRRGWTGYFEKVLVKEMRTRDREWLRTGAVAKIDYSGFSGKALGRLTANELKGHAFLQQQGFAVRAIAEDRSAAANIGLMLGGDLWELKSPVGASRRTLARRLNEGVSKWGRLHETGAALSSTPKIVLDNRFSNIPDTQAEECLVEAMRAHRHRGFDEAILVTKDGQLRRVRN